MDTWRWMAFWTRWITYQDIPDERYNALSAELASIRNEMMKAD